MGEIFERVIPVVSLHWTGERLTSATSGQVEIEHLHRYFFARWMCRGMDVLDVASGEGYGAMLLAQVARSVVGAEISEAAVEHAKAAYSRPNLRFLQGDARCLPIPDGTMDVVVSFETIEHFYEHEQFIAEVKRVLRPEGRFLVSSPERDTYSPAGGPVNPYHVRELTAEEFKALLHRSFSHISFYAQRPILGAALMAEAPGLDAGPLLTFERRDASHFEVSVGLPRPIYLVAVASDIAIEGVLGSLYVETSGLNAVFSRIEEAQQESSRIEEAQQERDRLVDARIQSLEAELASREQRHSDLQQELVRQRSEIERLRSEIERLRTASRTDQEQVAHLQRALAESGGNISHLERKIESLKSSRSWQITAPLRWVDHLFSWKGGLWSNLMDEAAILFWRIVVHSPIFHGARVLKYQTRRVTMEGLFDSQWYRNRYEGLPGVSDDPLLHYFILGVQRGCNPNPTFDSKWYLEKYPDVAATRVNPLFHYIEYGAKSGFRPGPDFDTGSPRANPNADGMRLTQLTAKERGLRGQRALLSSNPTFWLRPIAISGCATQLPRGRGRRMICMSHVIPYPPRAGNEYRIHRLLSWLAEQGWDVLLLICPLGDEPVSECQLAEAAAIYQNFIVCGRDGSVTYRLNDGAALLEGLRGRRARSFAALVGETNTDENRELETILRSFCPDLLAELLLHLETTYKPQMVLAEYVFMTRPFALLRPGTLKIVDTIDVFSTTYANVINYGVTEGLTLKPAAEANLLNRADLIVAIQTAEADALRRLAPQRQVINVGVDFKVLSNAPPSATEQVILFVGSDNARNVKGLKDFLRFAWPAVRRALPNAQLRIIGSVGQAAEPPLPGVQILGRVEDLAPAYAEARVVINPSVAGTGLKIKTIEAICHLRPIVVWPSGVDGVASEVRDLCQIATDWFEFTQHVIRLAGDEDSAQKLIERRGELVQYFEPKNVYAPLGTVLDAHATAGR